MSSTFSFPRFMKLARWTIATDSQYNRHWGSLYLVIFTVMLMMTNLEFFLKSKVDEEVSCIQVLAVITIFFLTGGSMMFNSFTKNHDALRCLYLLPASNAEKFVARYIVPMLTHLLMLIGSLLVADLLQYVVGLVIGRDPASLITIHTLRKIGHFMSSPGVGVILLFGLWIHTFFLLGCNFFRSIKYSWIFTAILLVLLFAVFAILQPFQTDDMYHSGYNLGHIIKSHAWFSIPLLIILSIVQTWLAYHLFSRRQLIGRFINRF